MPAARRHPVARLPDRGNRRPGGLACTGAHPRSLIQMATGAGKTFTACSFSWRLLKHARAKRILFLVDRSNLGNQTLKEFQDFQPPGAASKFTDIYITQQLQHSQIDPDAKVVITTIQRLYSILRGEGLAAEDEGKIRLRALERRRRRSCTYRLQPGCSH